MLDFTVLDFGMLMTMMRCVKQHMQLVFKVQIIIVYVTDSLCNVTLFNLHNNFISIYLNV